MDLLVGALHVVVYVRSCLMEETENGTSAFPDTKHLL